MLRVSNPVPTVSVTSVAAVLDTPPSSTETESAVPAVTAATKFAVAFKSVALRIATVVPAARLLNMTVSFAVVVPRPDT